jgi:hypothetical protein
LLTLIYCTAQLQQLPLGPAGMIGWVLSTGILGGILAINPAHELIHKTGWFERACGGLLLTSVGYHGFKIEHVRGHHVHVATPSDNSTARLGESVYPFMARAFLRNVANAWRLETRRLRALGCRPCRGATKCLVGAFCGSHSPPRPLPSAASPLPGSSWRKDSRPRQVWKSSITSSTTD